MNAAMKEQHFSRINDERARQVYDYLCASCELREGGLTDADQMLVYDYAYAEQVKQQLSPAFAETEREDILIDASWAAKLLKKAGVGM